ncbi:non-ribosomal peptide synthetase [Streptomyces sp. NPDC002659]|uniref:non-ribosomal peptide synthetase n=1 Tax=Streptomyces sp. NPDC002659 TaxID=3364656 RepID=UPI003682EA29
MKIAPADIAAERVRIDAWNSTLRLYPRETALTELLSRWSREQPYACAVADGDRELTYAELDRRANALAHRLADCGITAGDMVGLFGSRSIEAVIAIVAILKAGAVYVPLDPAHPRARLAAMAEDVGVTVVIELPGTSCDLPGLAQVLHVNDRTASLPPAPARTATGDDLGYVMFTSGSTGRPKAVGVRQRGITRLVVNTNYITITPEDHVLHVTALTFDLATFEIWGALLNGARLIVCSSQILFSPTHLRHVLESQRISVALLATAVFHHLAGQRPELFAGIRDLLVAGEALNLTLARSVMAHDPPNRLINAYGPTENTTFITAYLVNDLPAEATSMPIGTPIANTTCYVLREDGSPATIGEQGELVTGGDGVAAGYLNDPGLTAERFVPDPFAADPTACLYRTGDIASWQADGTIDFHGRHDTQLKVRGHRIEAAHIEAVLCSHPAVADAVVTRQETPDPGDAHLIAYLTRDEEHEPPTSAEINRHLGLVLPTYMIPVAFVWLEQLPLNPHGKVDRAALPRPPDTFHAPAPPAPAAPTLLGHVQRIWQDVLRSRGINCDITPDDNIYAIGGTSFDMIEIHTRITTHFDVPELTPLDLFQHPTPHEYAERISELSDAPQSDNCQ